MSLWEIGFWAGIFLAVVGFAGMAVSTLLIARETFFLIDHGADCNTISKKEKFLI